MEGKRDTPLYMETYIRRLKKGYHGPEVDAAGLLGGAKYHGKTTPLKGKGSPPADMKELETRPIRGMFPGRSQAPTDVLLTSRPSTADAVLFRPTKRIYGTARESHLDGVSARVSVEPTPYRKSRAQGSLAPPSSPHHTDRNIFNRYCTSQDFAEATTHHSRKNLPLTRPGTADLFMQYSVRKANAQFFGQRSMAPQNITRDLEDSRRVYMEALDDYCSNKVRALLGSDFRLG